MLGIWIDGPLSGDYWVLSRCVVTPFAVARPGQGIPDRVDRDGVPRSDSFVPRFRRRRDGVSPIVHLSLLLAPGGPNGTLSFSSGALRADCNVKIGISIPARKPRVPILNRGAGIATLVCQLRVPIQARQIFIQRGTRVLPSHGSHLQVGI